MAGIRLHALVIYAVSMLYSKIVMGLIFYHL